MSSIQHSITTKHDDKDFSKELTTSQSYTGEVTDVNDKKLKFKIDCWLMPMLYELSPTDSKHA
jgi:hypothetical protein